MPFGRTIARQEGPMATALTIHDEGTSGGRIRSFKLHLAAERISVRDLIERRVTQEVEEYNRAQPEYFQGLVQPTDAERVLNGYRLRQKRMLDASEQRAKAIEAFQRSGFFVLVDDRQLDGLDDEIAVRPDTEVRFVKLVPLVGG
jgi:hypothetical protein